MTVYVANLQIEQGMDFEHLFSLGDNDNNTTLNLSGFSISAYLRKWSGSTTHTAFTASIPAPVDGEIKLEMTDTTTNTLSPGRYVYDVVITDSSSKKYKVVEGSVLVRQGVTR